MGNRIILNKLSYHGYGALDNIKDVVTNEGFQNIVVFTDEYMISSKNIEKVTSKLDELAVEYQYFTDIQSNPTIKNVQAGLAALKEIEADAIIAVGGGSVIDCAKAAAIVHTNPDFEDVRSLEGVADTKHKCTPIIAIPTTAGTAAEVTINYVITDEESKKKMVCVDPNDLPIAAIVDPTMMESMPKELTASTGLDALTHAIEGYITKGAWELTDMFHLKSIELIAQYLEDAVDGKASGFEKIALAQYVAGMGFSNVGLGIVHSMAHPLGAVYNTQHGVANAIILPTVMAYNADVTGEKYREIARVMGVENVDDMSQTEYREAAIQAVKDLAKRVGIPETLDGIVKEEDIDFLAQTALDDACTPGNPKDPTLEDIKELYRSMLSS
ncbi:lactaldehyde reductase [Dolosigranulum pigrum]